MEFLNQQFKNSSTDKLIKSGVMEGDDLYAYTLHNLCCFVFSNFSTNEVYQCCT